MDDFYYEESNSKHIFLKCLLYLFILGIAVGIFIFYKKQNTMELKTITVEVGEKLSTNVEDYLKSGHKYSDDYKLYLNGVDTNTVGVYNYKIKYNKHTKTAKINVVDTTEPLVKLSNVTIGVDEEFQTSVVLESCEDASLPCKIEFVNESDKDKLKVEGTYNIEFKISDNEDNITNSNAIITVSSTETLSSKMTNDLEYYINSENDDTIEHVFFEKLESAIFEDTLEYEGMVQEISAIDFSEYTDKEIYSTKLITVYNKYGYVIGIQIEATYVDGTKELLTK